MSENHHDRPQGHHPNSTPAAPPPSPERLRRVGIIVAIVAVAVAIAGIAIRWVHGRDVKEWANARACPGGYYMHYILERCMYVRGGREGLKSDIKMVLSRDG